MQWGSFIVRSGVLIIRESESVSVRERETRHRFISLLSNSSTLN